MTVEIKMCIQCSAPVEVEIDSSDIFNAMLLGVICTKCQDERDAIEIEEKVERWRKRFVSVVGKKYRDTTLENYRAQTPAQRAALEAAKTFSASPSGFLYLHGTTGIGKTHLAVGIYREQTLESAHGIEFWRVPELLLHLRSQIGRDVSEEEAIEPLIKARVLILDDLGAEKITDWVRQAFYVVVSQREFDEMPTVFTSNLSLGEIEARIGDERITSRIGGAAKIIRVDGQDQRIAVKGRKAMNPQRQEVAG